MRQLEINKWIDEKRNDGVSSFTFKRDDNTFKIIFGGNLDLYFVLNYKDDKIFYIGKDNMAIYEIFDYIYNSVIFGNIFPNDGLEVERILFNCELYDEDYHEALKKYEQEQIDRKNYFQKLANTNGLVVNNEIIWKSDDFEDSIAPYFKITKLENAYCISFDIPEVNKKMDLFAESELYQMKHFNNISVRLRNSGSRYNYFNMPFMIAFRRLHELDLENHQIHIEEYLINEQIQKGDTLERILKK